MTESPRDEHELTEAEAAKLTLRARLGMVILALRSVALELLVLGANIFLARVLDPGDFGAFAIVQFVLSFSLLLGDAGLGGALIQQKRAPSQTELSTVFWAQMLLLAVLMGFVWAAAPFAKRVWPSLPEGSEWLLRALTLSVAFGFVRSVPSILMERDLQFGRLSILQLIHTVVFYVSVVVLAALGLRVWALVLGVVAESLCLLVGTYALRPWRPSLAFDREALRPMLRFGVAFQAKGIISFVSEAVMPLFAGGMIGKEGLGLVNWGRQTAYFPLKLVEIVGRVSFPLYSRLRSDKALLAREVARNVAICLVGTLFFVSTVLAIGEDIVLLIFGPKWLPGMPVLYVFSLAIALGFVSPIIAAAFDAIGEPQIFVRLSLMWTVVNWVTVATTMYFVRGEHRLLAFAIAYSAHVVVGNLAVLYVTRKKLEPLGIGGRVRATLVAAVVTALAGRFAVHPWAGGVLGVVGGTLTCGLAFAAVLLALDATARDDARALVEKAREGLRSLRLARPTGAE